MKKLALLLALVAIPSFATPIYAACYTFDNSNGYVVCVKGDSFSDRDKAKNICKKVKGSDCGNIKSYSSSCNGKCVDPDGKVKSSLSGF